MSEAQIEAAWAIYRDCRKQAEPIVRRMTDELDAARAKAERTENTRQTAGADRVDDSKAAESKPSRHERKLAEIFDTLKKRLNGLLRTTQENEVKAGS